MTLPIGELVGILALKGAAEFDAGIMGAQRSLNLAGESATKFGVSTDRAASGSAKLRAAQLSAIAASERYNALLTEGGASTARLASSEASLIRANERVATSFAQVGAAQKSAASESYAFASATRGGSAGTLEMVKSLGIMLGGLELAKKAFDFIGAGKDLTESLNQVQAVSRATDAQMTQVRAAVIGLGKDLTVPAATAVDAADAIQELVKAGIALPRAVEAARPALLLAAATNTDMAATAKVLGDTMDIFSIKGAGAAHAANIIGAATLGASHDLLGFFDAMKQAGPTAQAMKLNIDDVSTAIVYLAKHGLSTSMGGAAIKTFLTNLTKDTPKGTAALKDLGIAAFDAEGRFVGFPKIFDQLHAAYRRFGPDSERFLKDLNAAFGVRSQSAAALFGKTTGAALDEVHKKLETGDLQQFANTMNQGVAAGFRQVSKEATALGIDVYQNAEPALADIVALIGKALPLAAHVAADGLKPFEAGWHAIDGAVVPAAHALGDAAHFLSPLAPLLKDTGSAVIAMWLAFKGYEIARAAMFAVQDAASGMAARAKGSFLSMGAEFNAVNAQLATQSAVMEAEFLAIGAAAEKSAATQAESQLAAMRTYDQVSAKEIADMEAVAVAAQLAATEAAAAAEEAAAAVETAGATARVGWASIAGPVGLAALGVFTLVSMFHQSADAAKFAAAAEGVYTESVKETTDALGAANVASTNDALAKQGALQILDQFHAANYAAGISYVDLVKAVNGSQADFNKVAQAMHGTGYAGDVLLGKIRALRAGLQDTIVKQKDLTVVNEQTADTSHRVAASVDGVAGALGLTADVASKYAGMLGLVANKAGDLPGPLAVIAQHIGVIATAEDRATTSTAGLLAGMDTFAHSGQTAADRAALIGATLKAASGDSLAFASAMAGTTSAVDGLVDSFKQEQQQLAQQSNTQAQAAERVNVAQLRLNEMRNKGKHTAAEYASAEKSLHDAQAAAAKQGTLAYEDTMRAAIKFRDTQKGVKASIDTTAKGAGNLVQGLQQMQDAAVTAASAIFQHERAQKGAKRAADDAYNVYVSKTKGALIDEAGQLGLTDKQARALAKTYFGMDGKKVKTLIEAEGVNPVVQVLNKIGKLLANLTNQDWNVNVRTNVHETAAALSRGGFSYTPGSTSHPHRAAGGPVLAGHPYLVGEKRPEVFVPDANGRIEPDASKFMANGGQQKTVNIHGDVKLTAVYPEPDKDTEALPRLLRHAGEQIGSFL